MATPRDLLVIDAPGLTVADLRAIGPDTPGLAALARECSATIVPIAAGSAAARQASLCTGLLPSRHRVVHGGGDESLRVQPFWVRARGSRPGLKTVFFGNSPQLARCADVSLRSEGRSLVCNPADLNAYFQQGLASAEVGDEFENVLGHYAERAMAGNYGLVWVENARMLIGKLAQQASVRVGRTSADGGSLRRLDQFVTRLLRPAGTRPVVVLSSIAHASGLQGHHQPDTLRARLVPDGRILHVYCALSRAAGIAGKLQSQPAYARVLHGPARAELGLDCAEAGQVLAELRPGWGFAAQAGAAAAAPSGQDSPPETLPVLLARGLTIPKASIGMCEVAWLLQNLLTGQEFRDEA